MEGGGAGGGAGARAQGLDAGGACRGVGASAGVRAGQRRAPVKSRAELAIHTARFTNQLQKMPCGGGRDEVHR